MIALSPFYTYNSTLSGWKSEYKTAWIAHFCVDDCVKVLKIYPHFLTHGLMPDVLTYNAFLVMIITDAQTVAQNVKN